MADQPLPMGGNMFDRNVRTNKLDTGGAIMPLPLNLIALIISYLDSPGDLSRMCRTCRVFHYMTLPQLYTIVSLRSYDHIRYCGRDGRSQGCGMASPFSMGLSGLVSRNVAGYVRNFEVTGDWKEHDVEEYSKAGRVADDYMMLNTLVRVAVEKMAVIDSFSWDMSIKMLPTVWQGLAHKQTLTKLTIKFPSNRNPRPVAVAPPIPNLQFLKLINLDPLCYLDDLSLLLADSKKLRDLKLHWNPRIRETREPSINSYVYFGKLKSPMHLRSFAVVNLYTNRASDCHLKPIFDANTLEEITFLNSTSGIGDDGATEFMDGGYRKANDKAPPSIKMMRLDKVSHEQCDFLGRFRGLERLYLIGPHVQPRRNIKDPSTNATPLPHSPASSTSSPASSDINATCSLKDSYLQTITKHHGATLKHLLLLPQWRLTDDDIALIFRQCPNLEQLGMGADFRNFKNLRLMVPFLPNLTAIRLLGNPDDPTFLNQMREMDERGVHERKIGEETRNREWSKLKYMELGADDLIFEIGGQEEWERDGKKGWKRPVRKRGLDFVGEMDIWKMDSLEI